MCPEMYGWLVLSVAVLGNDGAFVGGTPQGWLDHRACPQKGSTLVSKSGPVTLKVDYCKRKSLHFFPGFLSPYEGHHSLTPPHLMTCVQM